MNGQLLLLLVDKVHIPHMMKGGILVSVLLFEGFEVRRRVKKKWGL